MLATRREDRGAEESGKETEGHKHTIVGSKSRSEEEDGGFAGDGVRGSGSLDAQALPRVPCTWYSSIYATAAIYSELEAAGMYKTPHYSCRAQPKALFFLRWFVIGSTEAVIAIGKPASPSSTIPICAHLSAVFRSQAKR